MVAADKQTTCNARIYLTRGRAMQKELLEEIEKLPDVSEDAANAFKSEMGRMVEKVNRIMSQRPDIRLLTGDAPFSLMFDNHKNHALFMSNVFSLNMPTLLVDTIPWVYHAYHSHGFSYSYFPAHIQSWRIVIPESLYEDNAAAMLGVYEWIESRHETFIELSKNIALKPAVSGGPHPETRDDFLCALLEGNREKSLAIARRFAASPSELSTFYVHIIQPAMYEIGNLWEKGEINSAREHLASAIVNRIMAVQYVEQIQTAEKARGTAVVTAAANEFHELGATMVANSLELDGWDVHYLGANTPGEELIGFIAQTAPDILAISSSLPLNLIYIRDVIRKIRAWPPEKQPKIMVGGLSFTNHPDLAEKLGADGYAPDAPGAIELARTWQKEA